MLSFKIQKTVNNNNNNNKLSSHYYHTTIILKDIIMIILSTGNIFPIFYESETNLILKIIPFFYFFSFLPYIFVCLNDILYVHMIDCNRLY